MNLTIKAILARCNGDWWAAVKYCNQVADSTSNPNLKAEYRTLAQTITHDHYFGGKHETKQAAAGN